MLEPLISLADEFRVVAANSQWPVAEGHKSGLKGGIGDAEAKGAFRPQKVVITPAPLGRCSLHLSNNATGTVHVYPRASVQNLTSKSYHNGKRKHLSQLRTRH